MNILPHKSWHVRTKKNIARVRKDEAQAAEEEKERQRKIALAAQEARTDFLRERATERFGHVAVEAIPQIEKPLEEITEIVQKDGHINFFRDIEDGIKLKCHGNAELAEEKKKEQEDYEKKIGYLTYLGQNSLEQTKEKPWYATIDRTDNNKSITVVSNASNSSSKLPAKKEDEDLAKLKDIKFKDFHDPLKNIRKYLNTPGVKQRTEKVITKLATKRPLKDEEDDSSDQPKKKLKKDSKKRVKKDKKHKKSKKSHKSKSKCKKTKHKHSKSEKKKKHTTSSSASSSYTESSGTDSEEEREREKEAKLKKLKAERLEREREERRRAEKVLAKLRGETYVEAKEDSDNVNKNNNNSNNISNPSGIKQKYNSQFNPHLARQNFDT